MDMEDGSTILPVHTLPALARDVFATVPGLVNAGAPRFDPRFYLLFWALELPDIQGSGDAYAAAQKDLHAALGTAKQRWTDAVKGMKLYEAELKRGAHARGAGGPYGGPPATANEVPIVTQAGVDAAEAHQADIQEKLRMMPAEKEECAARCKQWTEFFEARLGAFRLQSSVKNSMFFVQVRHLDSFF